jgi:hypothetical protein
MNSPTLIHGAYNTDVHTLGPEIQRSLFVPLGIFCKEDAPPAEMLAPPFLTAGDMMFIAGEGGVSKTWFIFHLMMAAADRGHICAYVSEEGKKSSIQKRWNALTHGDPGRYDETISICFRRQVRLDRGEWIEALVGHLKSLKARVLFLDPLADLISGNENDTQEMNAIKQNIRRIQKETDVAVVVAHHVSKAAMGKNNGGQAGLRGSTVLSGMAETVLMMRHAGREKGKADAWVEVGKCRDGLDVEKARFRVLTRDDGTVGTFLDDQEALDAVADGHDEERRRDLEDRLIDAVPLEGIAKRNLAKTVGGNTNSTLAVINALISAGRLLTKSIVREGKTLKDRVFKPMSIGLSPSGPSVSEKRAETETTESLRPSVNELSQGAHPCSGG